MVTAKTSEKVMDTISYTNERIASKSPSIFAVFSTINVDFRR